MRPAPAQARFAAVIAVLAASHFAVRPWLGDQRYAPDFVLVALLFFAIRARPMVGSIAGFLVGLVTDAVAPTAFGAAAVACTVVGYSAGWLKAVAFADNLLMTALFVFAASWVRDAIVVLVARQVVGGALAWQLFAVAPLAGLTTAAVAVAALVAFRGWLRQGIGAR